MSIAWSRLPPYPAPQRLVDVIFFDAGGGHRTAAMALKASAERQRRDWRVRMVNLREVLEPIDLISRVTGVQIENVYNAILKYGLTVGSGAMLRTTQALIRRLHPYQVALLARFWERPAPDLVVSLIPNFNRAILEGLRAADTNMQRVSAPMVTIMTDLADYPPHFWIESQPQYLICGTQFAVQQALRMGHSPQRVFRASGMIVRPGFYEPAGISRAAARRRIGLEPDVLTGLVMFGGYGSRRMATIAARVAAAGLKTQLVFICGHNQQLRDQLTAMRLPFPHHIEGFTPDIAEFMRLADFFIGKPGPGSISEALVMGLPLIVERNALTMVQERYNTQWIAEHGLGLVLRSFSEIAAAVERMQNPAQLNGFRARVGALENRAVFEIPEILELLMAGRPNDLRAGAEASVN
ncbi:MAG TPA: glycosyltransferase [Candidatus Binataceae bacterium]|nr:glycosyltransferase [Candidatus Binataceae bacterium]